MRVLLVDGHGLAQLGLTNLLLNWGIEVVGEVESGAAALEAARRLHPDAIVVDTTRATHESDEARRLIEAELPEIKIVLVAASDEAEGRLNVAGGDEDARSLEDLARTELRSRPRTRP